MKSYSNVALEKVNRKLKDIKEIPSTWTWRFVFSLMGVVGRGEVDIDGVDILVRIWSAMCPMTSGSRLQ